MCFHVSGPLRKDDADFAADIKQRIREDLSKRYNDLCIDHLLTVSCFIDPRFKCAELPEDRREVVIDGVKEELVEIAAMMEDTQSPIQESESQDSEPPRKKTKSVLGRILGTNVGTSPAITSQVPSDRAQREIERYISFPCQEIDSTPLNWWKRGETQFPLSSKLARKYLCICATSVASERVLSSTGGNIVSDTRNSLKPQRVDELVFLAKNLS